MFSEPRFFRDTFVSANDRSLPPQTINHDLQKCQARALAQGAWHVDAAKNDVMKSSRFAGVVKYLARLASTPMPADLSMSDTLSRQLWIITFYQAHLPKDIL